MNEPINKGVHSDLDQRLHDDFIRLDETVPDPYDQRPAIELNEKGLKDRAMIQEANQDGLLNGHVPF